MTTSQILKLVAGMFNGAPGGAILGNLSQAVDSGMSLSELADILENTNQFQSLVGDLDTAGQVEYLMNNFGLTPNGEAGSPAARAENFFTSSIEGGVGLGRIVDQAIVFLERDDLPEEFAEVAALMNNKALVAGVHAENHSTIANVAAAQALFVGVTSTLVNFGNIDETVVINAAGVVGGTNAVAFTGKALAYLTVNLVDDADFVVAGQDALQTVAIDATGNASTVTAEITVDATEEFSLTRLTLTDSSEGGDATIDVTLTETPDLISITLSGGEVTTFSIDAGLAEFLGIVTINIGDFGVDEVGNTSGGLTYTAAASNLREVFKFTGNNIGDVEITDFLAGVGGNADRLDFSAFEGVTGLDDMNITYDGTNTVISSDAFAGDIAVNGVDLSTDAFNFVF